MGTLSVWIPVLPAVLEGQVLKQRFYVSFDKTISSTLKVDDLFVFTGRTVSWVCSSSVIQTLLTVSDNSVFCDIPILFDNLKNLLESLVVVLVILSFFDTFFLHWQPKKLARIGTVPGERGTNWSLKLTFVRETPTSTQHRLDFGWIRSNIFVVHPSEGHCDTVLVRVQFTSPSNLHRSATKRTLCRVWLYSALLAKLCWSRTSSTNCWLCTLSVLPILPVLVLLLTLTVYPASLTYI